MCEELQFDFLTQCLGHGRGTSLVAEVDLIYVDRYSPGRDKDE